MGDNAAYVKAEILELILPAEPKIIAEVKGYKNPQYFGD